MWFDPDVNRLNYDDHGKMLGEFYDDDQILVILSNGDYYLSNFDLANHNESNILRIEKYDADKVWTAVLYDADNQGYPYLKRFQMDATKKKQNWLSDNPASQLLLLTDTPYPRLQVTYGGADAFRDSEEIDAEQFIAVKGYKAKGKRLTTYALESIEEQDPQLDPRNSSQTSPASAPSPSADSAEELEDLDPDAGKSEQQIRDELTGQLNLFDNEDFK